MNRLLIALPFALFAACSEDSSPSAPSSTTTSPATTAVTVTVSDPVRMGQTAQATGSETLTGGQTRSITSGWLTDAPAIATVTNTGLVTGVANGRATIYVVAGGRQGQQVVRVVPDYHGRWSGGLRVTSCTENGLFASLGFCKEFAAAGETYGYDLSLSQSGTQMAAVVDYGAPWLFPSVTAAIRDDGTSSFAPTVSVNESGVTLSLDATFNINSARTGELTGTVNEVWRIPNFSGEGRLTQDIVSTSRVSTATRSRIGDGNVRQLRLLRKLTLQKR